jgi:hypothetical protein
MGLDLELGVSENSSRRINLLQVMWDKGVAEPADKSTFLRGNNPVKDRINTAGRGLKCVKYRISYVLVIPRGYGCEVILDMCAPTEDKIDVKDNFYEELECAVDQFPTNHIEMFVYLGKVKLSLYRPWRPLGLREVEAPTFSDIRHTDGGKVVSPTLRPLLTPRKIPGTHFC